MRACLCKLEGSGAVLLMVTVERFRSGFHVSQSGPFSSYSPKSYLGCNISQGSLDFPHCPSGNEPKLELTSVAMLVIFYV